MHAAPFYDMTEWEQMIPIMEYISKKEPELMVIPTLPDSPSIKTHVAVCYWQGIRGQGLEAEKALSMLLVCYGIGLFLHLKQYHMDLNRPNTASRFDMVIDATNARLKPIPELPKDTTNLTPADLSFTYCLRDSYYYNRRLMRSLDIKFKTHKI